MLGLGDSSMPMPAIVIASFLGANPSSSTSPDR